jgi:site-specific DNA-cytosine methylase
MRSGVDVVMYVLGLLSKSWASLFNLNFTVTQEFASDIKESAQRFLRKHWPGVLLFGDLNVLSDTHATDLNNINRPVLSIHWLFAGFECDSISSLNADSQNMKSCIETASGKTGRTARGVLNFIKRHQPVIVTLENLKSLALKSSPEKPSNLEFLQSELNALGYTVLHHVLGSHNFGIPQHRDRAYVTAIRVGLGARDQRAEDYQPLPWMSRVGFRIQEMTIGMVPVQKFLLPPNIVATIRQARQV